MIQTKRFRSLLQNKDARTLASNFAWLSILQIAGYVFPLITMPYLARVIGVDGFGKIAFAAAIMIWIQTITDWGFNYTATRDVAKNRENINTVSEIFSQVLWARVLLMCISFVILIILIIFIPKFKQSADIILISFLLIPGHILFPEWFFQAMEKMKYITILNLLSKLLFTAAVFIIIKHQTDYIYQPLLTSLGFIVSGCLAMYNIINHWGIKIHRPNWHSIITTLKNSYDVFLNNLMPNLYNSFSVILLGVYSNPKSNGILDAGSKFVGIISYFVSVISRTFFPFLSRKIEHHNKFTKISLLTSIVATVLLFLFSPLLINTFYTDLFDDAIIVSRILSISILFLTVSNVYGTNFLILEGYERQLRNITFGASLTGMIIAIPVIYCFNYIGAAFTICITRGILAVSIYLYARKKLKNVCNILK